MGHVLRSERVYHFKDLLHNCGHKTDRTYKGTHASEEAVKKWYEKEDCQNCKLMKHQQRIQAEQIAIAYAKDFMMKYGITDCYYKTINDNKKVVVTMYIDMPTAL